MSAKCRRHRRRVRAAAQAAIESGCTPASQSIFDKEVREEILRMVAKTEATLKNLFQQPAPRIKLPDGRTISVGEWKHQSLYDTMKVP